MKTKFTTLNKTIAETETTFTDFLGTNGWIKPVTKPSDYVSVIDLGKWDDSSNLFIAFSLVGGVGSLFKGVKGLEFNY